MYLDLNINLFFYGVPIVALKIFESVEDPIEFVFLFLRFLMESCESTLDNLN